jgi:tRNA nucleotidyltransferase (CCA-adding enzyme)
MKTFRQFLIEEAIKDFNNYISKNPMLKTGIDVLKKLSKYGDAYIVGGAVRDIILGQDPKDVDIATNVPMDKIESIFTTFDIGKNKDFGIVVIKHKGHQFEVANFRKDIYDYQKPKYVRKILK